MEGDCTRRILRALDESSGRLFSTAQTKQL